MNKIFSKIDANNTLTTNGNNNTTKATNNMTNNTTNNNITTNNINNPIIILPHGKEDYSEISDEELKKIIGKCFMAVPSLVSKIHCNENHPENHNIKKTNLRDNKIHVYDGDEWIVKSSDDTLEDLYGRATSFFE